MSNVRTAQRYARAMIDLGAEMKNLDNIFRDFELLRSILQTSRDFKLFLKNPVLSSEKKRRVLAELLTDKVSEVTMKFVILLVKKNREGILAEIIHEFKRLHDLKLGILDVNVKAAITFSSGQQDHLVRQLGSVTKMKVKVKYEIDETLKGGFKVQFYDTVWDASVQHQLDLLRKRFAEGTI